MDLVDTLHVARYWSECLCYTLMTRLCDLQVKVINFELPVSFYVSGKTLTSQYFLSFYKLILCLLLDIGLKFNYDPSPQSSGQGHGL